LKAEETKVRKIATEEHFITQPLLDQLRERKIVRAKDAGRAGDPAIAATLLDLGERRIAEMDKAGIDMQVLSIGTGLEDLDAPTATVLARDANDRLADAVKKHPDRFAAFASLGYEDAVASAKELERAVKSLGFVGAKVNSNVKGEFLDERKYWPLWEAAAALGVPVYIHPREPAAEIVAKIGYPELTSAIWGYGADASLNALRLIFGGVFDAYPSLKIILGHLGEALPFWSWRIDNRWKRSGAKRPVRAPSEYLAANFWVTTSGMFGPQALTCVHQVLGAERILFAVDYPYESSEEGSRFIDNAPLSESDRAKICHGNAESLFRISPER
jgi:2,3-dihydroxybenzoate decarboxylase